MRKRTVAHPCRRKRSKVYTLPSSSDSVQPSRFTLRRVVLVTSTHSPIRQRFQRVSRPGQSYRAELTSTAGPRQPHSAANTHTTPAPTRTATAESSDHTARSHAQAREHRLSSQRCRHPRARGMSRPRMRGAMYGLPADTHHTARQPAQRWYHATTVTNCRHICNSRLYRSLICQPGRFGAPCWPPQPEHGSRSATPDTAVVVIGHTWRAQSASDVRQPVRPPPRGRTNG